MPTRVSSFQPLSEYFLKTLFHCVLSLYHVLHTISRLWHKLSNPMKRDYVLHGTSVWPEYQIIIIHHIISYHIIQCNEI